MEFDDSQLVTICDAAIDGYLSEYPQLHRFDVMHAIIAAGPWRAAVDRAVAAEARRRGFAPRSPAGHQARPAA